MPVFRKRAQKVCQGFDIALRQGVERGGRQLEVLRQAEERPGDRARCERVRVRRVRLSRGRLLLRVATVEDERRHGAGDAPGPPARQAGQLALVEQPESEIGRDIGRVPRLPRIVGVVAEPADESRPPGQLRQVPCQILLPARLGNAEAAEHQRNRVVRPLGQGPHLSSERFDAEETAGEIPRSQPAPGLVQAALSRRHRPARHALVHERGNPLGRLFVDPLDDGLACELLHPVPDATVDRKVDRRGRRLVRLQARASARRASPQFAQISGSAARRIGTSLRALFHRIRKVVLQLVQRAADAERPGEQHRF